MSFFRPRLCIWLVSALALFSIFAAPTCATERPEPIHLDDIHLIVTNEAQAVAFFIKHFGAREMAHPGVRFELVRFLSLKWQGPTITITGVGPYKDLPPERNQRWTDATLVLPSSERNAPVYGARWLALATPSLDDAMAALDRGGIKVIRERVILPMERSTPASSVAGPDGLEIVIVERPGHKFGDAAFKIDHIQFLVSDVEKNEQFFERAFKGQVTEKIANSSRMRVADADLIISNARALDIAEADVLPRQSEGTIRTGLDHLGFLYENIGNAAQAAANNGVSPTFPPRRYVYKGKPTVYTFTAFKMPDDYSIEMVQADGRIGPHSYYLPISQ